MVQLALVPLALLLPASATAAPVLRVSLPRSLDCPSPSELLESLSQRFGAERVAAGEPSGNELGLSLSQLPDGLEIDLVSKRGEAPFRRRLPYGEGSCADLAETIGLVVDAWLRNLPWHGVGFLRDVPEVVRPGTSERAAPEPSVTQAPSPAKPKDAGPTQHGEALTLRLGGGGGLGSDATQFGPLVSLSADLALYRGLGAAVFVSALENASATDRLSGTTTASLSVHRQVLTVAARYAFAANGASGLRLFAGLALQALESRSSGLTSNPATFEVVPAGFVAGLWQQKITGNLSAYAQLSVTLGREINFDVLQGSVPRQVLSLPPGWLDGSLGLALTFN